MMIVPIRVRESTGRLTRPRVGSVVSFVVGVLLAGATVVSGVVRRTIDGWQPQGDDAAIAWLSHDVFTANSPLLGMPSTLGGGKGSSAYHLGPMLFWLLGVFQRLAGDNPVGLQIGLLVLELAALSCIAVFTYRRLGRLATLTMLVLVSIMTWSLGRDVLSSIWNPNIALLPLACVFVVAWSVADGDRVAFPVLIVFASFVVQCNLLYAPLVAALVLWSGVGFVVTSRRERIQTVQGVGEPRSRRVWWTSAILLLACWIGLIIYELTHRPGNISQVLTNGTGEAGQHVGILRSAYALVHALGVVPVWSRPLSSLSEVGGLLSPAGAVKTVTALAIGLAVVLACFAVLGAGQRSPRFVRDTDVSATVRQLVDQTRRRLPVHRALAGLCRSVGIYG